MNKSDEIEITPEMIDAGAAVLAGFETYFSDEEMWAERVYRAMAALRPNATDLKTVRACRNRS